MSRPQRQLPFSQCHFVGFLPSSRLHSSFSEVDPFFSCNFCSMNIFLFFCQQCAGNPSEDGNFFRFQYVPVTKTVPEQKRRSGEECYFDTDLPGNNRYRSLDKAEESEKIQKDPEGTNSITILCHCSFQHNHKNRVYLQTYTSLQNGRL